MGRCILVVGYPRTGTSLVAGILHKLGVCMGQEFQKPNDANPLGFFSDLELERELAPIIFGKSNERFAELVQLRNEQSLWGYKSGGGGMCVPLVSAVVKPFIIATRRPLEQSRASFRQLTGRDTYDATYVREIAATQPYVDGAADFFVDYPELVASPATEVARIAEAVGLPISQDAVDFIKPELWRHRNG